MTLTLRLQQQCFTYDKVHKGDYIIHPVAHVKQFFLQCNQETLNCQKAFTLKETEDKKSAYTVSLLINALYNKCPPRLS